MTEIAVGFVGACCAAGILLWKGIVQGVRRQHIPGGFDNPTGWSGRDAQYIGAAHAFAGAAAASFAAAFMVAWFRGSNGEVSWASLPAFLATIPPAILLVATGVSILLYARRNNSKPAYAFATTVIFVSTVGLVLFIGRWVW